MSFVIGQPCELSWHIRINDMAVDIGSIKWNYVVDPSSFVGDESEDAMDGVVQVVHHATSWKNFALPILINELTLEDEPLSAGDTLQNVPIYEDATFTLDVGGAMIWWGLKGCGFGQYYLRTVNGYPYLSNECMNKGTILKVFQQIVLP